MSPKAHNHSNGAAQKGQQQKTRAKNLDKKWRAGVLGATGIVGQRLVRLLAEHPWFELNEVAAAERSSGRSYAEAVHWHLESPIPEVARDLVEKASSRRSIAISFFPPWIHPSRGRSRKILRARAIRWL